VLPHYVHSASTGPDANTPPDYKLYWRIISTAGAESAKERELDASCCVPIETSDNDNGRGRCFICGLVLRVCRIAFRQLVDSNLVRSHSRSLAPLPDAELKTLKHAIRGISAIGRNLNQIAVNVEHAAGRPKPAVRVAAPAEFTNRLEALDGPHHLLVIAIS
jgi:hypothetical protein